ncbi:nicotinamidase [Nitrosophilus alvini]|uniref:nicotinamidase n=1 Tax=Nitrosophilus alvini TaxID=2714855 RepID=UPI00190DD79C|nr:nicotinamidase [Nitrosophilus alvini]
MKIKITDHDALIVVDMQKDFLPGGALPVSGADKIIPNINMYIKLFEENSNPVYFTRDWHPKEHISFKGQGGIWPPHCIQDSEGAMFDENLYIPADNKFVISKGVLKEFDAYSGFQGTVLNELLKEKGIKRVFICGVATDYCVKNTLLGAVNLGYFTILLKDGIKGVDINPGDTENAIDAMMQKGAVLCSFSDIVK